MSKHISIDDLQRNGLKIIQDNRYFKFGMDAVLLADFAKIKKNSKVIDFGTGNGILPLLIYARENSSKIIGLDIQEELVALFKKSLELNKISEESIRAICADIKNIDELFEPYSFDYIVTNPPYMKDKGILNKSDSVTIARHETLIDFEAIARQSYKMLKQYGTIYLVNRPNRLTDVLSMLRENKIEPKRLRMVASHINDKPHLFLLEAKKFSKPDLYVDSTLYIYNEDGTYTKEVMEIYGMG